MATETFGIRVPGGDPGALDGAASDLSGASGSLERSTTSVRDSATATPSWEGFGNLQFFNSCTVQADTIALGVDVLDTASMIVAEVAEKLRAAKKSAKLAVDDAQEADTRRGRAEDAMQDAQQEALAARLRATWARNTGVPSSMLLPNAAASAEETHALKQAEAADQQAAAAQRSRDRAQGDLENAQNAGNNAEREYTEAANDAARMIASLLHLTPHLIGPTGAAAAATGGPGAPEALIPFATRTGSAPTGEHEDDGFLKSLAGGVGDLASSVGDAGVGAFNHVNVFNGDQFTDTWGNTFSTGGAIVSDPLGAGAGVFHGVVDPVVDEFEAGGPDDALGFGLPAAIASVVPGGAAFKGLKGLDGVEAPDAPDKGVDRGDGRDSEGKFTGAGGYGKAAEGAALNKYESETGRLTIRDQVRASVPGATTGRQYDGLVLQSDGTYLAIEVKSNSAARDAAQRSFDALVTSDNPARAVLHGAPIEITQVIEYRYVE